MTRFPHTTQAPWPTGRPGRFAELIRTTPDSGTRVALLGLPDDLGVRLNGGRPGAAQGPRAFRDALARYGVAEPAGWQWPGIVDAGDVTPAPGNDTAALHATHRRVSDATRAICDAGLFPIAVGGGHDLTLAFVRGVLEHRSAKAPNDPISGVNFDAHLDVRPEPGSGMAMRALLESGRVRRIQCRGLNRLTASAAHVDWFEKNGGRIFSGATEPANRENTSGGDVAEDPSRETPAGPFFATFDLDVLDAAHSPGVSAMNPCGWTPDLLEAWVRTVGGDRGLLCADFMELNPSVDEGGRTARLAAHLFLVLLRALATRGRFRA
jgi:formiminoglutamase